MPDVTHCISVPSELIEGGPADLAEQLGNEDRIPLREMSSEAYAVLEKCWDPAVDGGPWPPYGGIVVKAFVD